MRITLLRHACIVRRNVDVLETFFAAKNEIFGIKVVSSIQESCLTVNVCVTIWLEIRWAEVAEQAAQYPRSSVYGTPGLDLTRTRGDGVHYDFGFYTEYCV